MVVCFDSEFSGIIIECNQEEEYGQYLDNLSLFNNNEWKIITSNKKPTFSKSVKNITTKASVRLGSRKLTSQTKKLILSYLKDKKADSNTITFVKEALDTEAGSGLISLLIGTMLTLVPKLNQNHQILNLAEEFQIEGASIIEAALLDEVMKYFLPLVKEIINTSKIAGIKL